MQEGQSKEQRSSWWCQSAEHNPTARSNDWLCSRTDHQHILCDYSLLQENARNLVIYSSPLAFFSLFAAICFPCCRCLQDIAGKQILVEEPEADLKFNNKGFSCPFHLTKCTFCYHPAQVVITEYLICLRLPVSKGTIRKVELPNSKNKTRTPLIFTGQEGLPPCLSDNCYNK